jgi:hypothetical protein
MNSIYKGFLDGTDTAASVVEVAYLILQDFSNVSVSSKLSVVLNSMKDDESQEAAVAPLLRELRGIGEALPASAADAAADAAPSAAQVDLTDEGKRNFAITFIKELALDASSSRQHPYLY